MYLYFLYFYSSVGILFPDLRYHLDKMKYKETENNTWASLVHICEDENIQLADTLSSIPSIQLIQSVCLAFLSFNRNPM